MESAISSPPQGAGTGSSSQVAASSSLSSPSSSSSGSIGPFFAVISVVMFLAIVSCVLGRICISRRMTAAPVTPLDTIKHGGWLGWLKRKCRHCMAGEVEVGAKVMSYGEDNKSNDHEHPPQV